MTTITRRAVADADVLRPLDGGGVERAVPHEPGQGPDRAVDRLRPADADRLRPRLADGARARSARSACRSSTSATCARCSTASRPAQMNTSMTINATAAWLLALYVANAEEQGTPSSALRGTTQNDIVKEYLSRGTYIFPPEPSRRLIVDMVAWCAEHAPKWNPMNVCSYHLQEAGATPVQELAYSLATAIGVLDAVRDSGQVEPEQFAQVFGSISFFVNAGIRFVEEICKLRAFTELWDRIGLERYGVDRRQGAPLPLRRAGQQPRPHRGAAREQRAAHRARDARRSRCRSGPGRAASSCRRGTRRSACPARGTSSGRCGCNRCSRSRPTCSSTTTSSTARTSSRRRTAELRDAAQAELDDVLALGGAFEAVDDAEGAARVVDGRAHPPHRVRRPDRRRRQPLHRDRAVAARRRRQRS